MTRMNLITGVVLAGALVAAALGPPGPAAVAHASPAASAPDTAGGTQLRRDVAALHALGVTGVLARLEAGGRTEVARAGAGVPADPYLRIGSTTKTFVAVVVLQL